MHCAKQLRKRRTYLMNRFKLIECKVRKMRLHYCVNYQGGHYHYIKRKTDAFLLSEKTSTLLTWI